jgi:hypothetical protein
LEDIKVCEAIYGLDIYALKGKAVRPKPKVVVNDYVEVPRELVDAHKSLILCVDIMYIDELPFLVTVSKYIKYITIRFIDDRSNETILEALQFVFPVYQAAGFTVKEIHCDREFASLQSKLEREYKVTVNLTSAQEHQPDVERAIRTIKERYRAMYHRCPFKMWPKLMIIRGASEAVKWLNSFPPAGGLSAQYSPRAIVLGRPIEYNTHCVVSFGSYVQAYTHRNPTNTPAERTIDAIFLRTMDTIQGGYEVMNLQTGKVLYRYKITEVPMPPHVINRVEQLAKKDGFLPHNEPIFRTYALLGGVDDTQSDDESHNNEADQNGGLLEVEEEEVDEEVDDQYGVPEAEDEVQVEVQVEVEGLLDDGVLTPGVAANDEQSNDEQSTVTDEHNDEHDPEEEQQPDPDNEPIPREPRRSERIPKPRQILDLSDGGPLYTTKAVKSYGTNAANHIVIQPTSENKFEYDPEEAIVLARAFAQTYNLTKGIAKFGQKGEQAAQSEMRQLHERGCFRPVHINSYDPNMRKHVMESIFFSYGEKGWDYQGKKCHRR